MKAQATVTNKNQLEMIYSSLLQHREEDIIKNISNLNKGLLEIYSSRESLAFLTSIISRIRNESIILVVDTPERSRSLYEDCSVLLQNQLEVIHLPEIDTHPMSGLEFGSFSNTVRNGAISRLLDLKNK